MSEGRGRHSVMAKTTKKSKKPTKPAKKPFTVEIHGEDFDLSLESRNVGDDADDLTWLDKVLEKISTFGAKSNHPYGEILSDIETIEALTERAPDEDDAQYATNIVALSMAFGRKLDSNLLRVVIHTLQQEYNDRPTPAEPASEEAAQTE